MVILVKDESMLCYLCPLTVALACKVVTMWAFDMISHKFKHAAISVLHSDTGSPCNSRILGEMEIRELQNREFQGPPYLGLDVA